MYFVFYLKSQIDIIIERDDGIIDICENKYTDTPFSISESYERNLLKEKPLNWTDWDGLWSIWLLN